MIWRDFLDKAQSFGLSGTWQFYNEEDYKDNNSGFSNMSRLCRYNGPGKFASIKSFRYLGPLTLPKIQFPYILEDVQGQRGEEIVIEGRTANNFPFRTQAAIVTGSASWTLFSGADYTDMAIPGYGINHHDSASLKNGNNLNMVGPDVPFGAAKDAMYLYRSPLSDGIRHRHLSNPATSSETGVPVSEFIPFGTSAGDVTLVKADDTFEEIMLTNEPSFLFFNSTYDRLYLNTNGGISFGKGFTSFTPTCGTLDLPMIVPYWGDVDTRLGGQVYYRQTTSGTTLESIEALLRKAFPSTGSSILKPVWAFITTWEDVAFFGASPPSPNCPGANLGNTFQTILVRTENQSHVIFLYNKITWTAGSASLGDPCTGRGGRNPAKAGFDYGDGSTFFELPNSCTEDVPKIMTSSNIDEPGKWAFRVTENVEERNCDVECGTDVEYLLDPFDCSQFYQCSNGQPHRMQCPPMPGTTDHLVFDPTQNVCVWPSTFACKAICRDQSYFI